MFGTSFVDVNELPSHSTLREVESLRRLNKMQVKSLILDT